MQDTDTREQAQPLTPLAAFGECLAIVECAEPQHRKTILAALGNYRLDDIIDAGAVDWETRARKRKIRIDELKVELDAALADVADLCQAEESDFDGEPDSALEGPS